MKWNSLSYEDNYNLFNLNRKYITKCPNIKIKRAGDERESKGKQSDLQVVGLDEAMLIIVQV